MITASSELQLLRHPYATFRRLSTEPPGWIGYLRRPALWFIVVSAFVSFTTSGRLILSHLVWSTVAWSFGPALQLLWLFIVIHLLGWRGERSLATELFFVSQAPWLVFLSLLAGLCALPIDTWSILDTLLRAGVLPGLFAATFGYGIFLTFCCLFAGLGLSRRAAISGTLAWCVGYGSTLVLYFWGTGQLPPLLLALR